MFKRYRFSIFNFQSSLFNLAIMSVAVGLPLSAVAQSAPNDYPIGPGDQIDITVADYPEFTGTKTVMPDGSIALPVVGQIPVASQTSTEAATRLQTALDRYLKNPVVTVSLIQLRPVNVTVVGEVFRPGPVQITLSRSLAAKDQSPNDLPTIPSAIAAAGGVTSKADLQHVQLRRGNDSIGTTITVDLESALMGRAAAPTTLMVHDGDTIVIPKRTDADGIDPRLLARSVYAPKTVRVRVVGEVKRPGEVEVPTDSTLSAAVAIAGGATEKGKLSAVTFLRRDESGALKQREIDLKHPKDDPLVQDGDVLVVPMKGGAKFLDTFGQILNPLGSVFNLLRY